MRIHTHNKTMRNTDRQKKINILKNMYFNRYLMIRYFFAIFFFANFYWTLFTKGNLIMTIPTVMLLLAIPPFIENIRCYGSKNAAMCWTKRFYQCQIVVCACLMMVVFTGLFNIVLPFLNDTLITHIILFIVSLLGFIISYACILRLSKIEKNEDHYFSLIQKYEKSLHLHL